MSYAPGHDGPPVSELPDMPDQPEPGELLCCPKEGIWTRDRYYADRWADNAPDCYVWTHSCGKSFKGDQL